MALVAAGTWNCSAANFRTAVNGVVSGTLNLQMQIINAFQQASLLSGKLSIGRNPT